MFNTVPISVFLTSFNGEQFIEEQIESILSQTSPADELIVCDDRSSDATIAILKKYRAKGFLKYFINDQQKGVTANFAQALHFTKKNNWVAFADQDDIWLPERLSLLKKAITTTDPQLPFLLYSDAILINEKKEIINPSFWNELGLDHYRHTLATLVLGNYVLGCSSVINPLLKQYLAAMPAKIALHHDAWIALCAYCFGGYREIDTPLVYYRKHLNNVTAISRYTKTETILGSLTNHVHAFIRNDYLNDQIALIELFIQQYRLSLSKEQLSIMQTFLKIKNKSYLTKKKIIKNILQPYWE